MSATLRTPVALAIATCAAALCAAFGGPAFISAIVVLWFLAVVPGTLLCAFLDVDGHGAFHWAVIVGTSFSIDVLVSEVLLYAHIWTPERALLVLVVLALVALVAVPRVRTMSRG